MNLRQEANLPEYRNISHQIHTFSLRPLPGTVCQVNPIIVQFSPEKNIQGQLASTFPTIHKDNGPFNRLFSLRYLQTTQNQNQTELKSTQPSPLQLNYKITQENKQILEPIPTKKSCQICKEKFSDYSQHISFPRHIKKVQKSPFHVDSMLLIQKFQLQIERKSLKRQKPSFSEKEQFSVKKGTKKRIVENENNSQKSHPNYITQIGSTDYSSTLHLIRTKQSQFQQQQLEKSPGKFGILSKKYCDVKIAKHSQLGSKN